MILIPIKKDILIELIDNNLKFLDGEIRKILAKWNYKSSSEFLQDFKEGKIKVSEAILNKLDNLVNKRNELIELRDYSNNLTDTLIKNKKESSLLKIKKVLEEFKRTLVDLYGKNLKDVVLYGSYARGEEREESDVDIAVILKGNIRPFEEIDRIVDATYHIGLQHDVLISVHPISELEYLTRKSPFLTNVKEEGISI